MSLDLSRVPVRREGAEGSHFGQEFVILDPPGRILRGLNETGARVWDLIDGRRCVEEIARVISDEFEVDGATAQADVTAFITMLAGRGLVELREGPEQGRTPGEGAT